MTEATVGGGLDRRSLIKKGLVAGGVVATVPVISTFNAPAFAASPGTYRVRLTATLGALGIIVIQGRGPDQPAACAQINTAWAAASPDPGPAELAISLGGTALPPRLLVQTTEPGCVITDARIAGNGNNCTNALPTGTGTPTASFPFLLGVTVEVFAIVTCS